MAELTAKTRNALPGTAFALAAQRKYPIHNLPHAENALARSTQQHNAGNLSDADFATVQRKAHAAVNRFKNA